MRFPEYRYRQSDQPKTEGDRTVELIAGDPTGIIDRGEEIKDLGELMQRAATTLSAFADGSLGAGKSIDKIRSVAEDVYADLDIAGKLYAPSGQALQWYGQALDRVQIATDSLVPNSETKWEDVVSAACALQAANSEQEQYDQRAERSNTDDTDMGERPSTASEQNAFNESVEEWEAYWLAYDTPVGIWERAYERAVTRLENANESGPEDGFWDNAMPFVEGLLNVLAWVGLAAFALALILSGPLALLLGAIAIVAGILVVLLEASKFLADRGDMGSLLLSIAGILPFGKIGSLIGKGGRIFPAIGGGIADVGSQIARGFRTLRDVNGPLLRGGDAIVMPLIMPKFYAIDSAIHFLVKNPPGLNSLGRIMENLTGIPGGAAGNLPEALGGLSQAFGSGFSALDTALGLADAGRHAPGTG